MKIKELQVYQPISAMINKTTPAITEEMATVFGVSSFVPGKNANGTPINRNKACRSQFKILNLYPIKINMAADRVYRFSICLNKF
jgi:hypothetical protein